MAFPVEVERSPTGEYVLRWDERFGPGTVRLRVHTEADRAAQSEPLFAEARPGVRIGLPFDERHYFHLETQAGETVTVAQRDVPLEGGTNFRDLGGYRAADGRRVRWGRLFRSGHTAGFSERDRETVGKLDIRVCCDFRREAEHHIEPSRLPAQTRIVSVAIDPGSIGSFFERIVGGEVSPDDMAAFMEEINRNFVHRQHGPFRRMFRELLALEGGSFMINCAAGKDRTGFGAAMILAALGVDEEDIVADYLLSQRYFPIERELDRVRRKYARQAGDLVELAMIMPMMETRETYLRAALDEIRNACGGLGNYLESALGIGPRECELLRARFTV